jgi:hypothetical protein
MKVKKLTPIKCSDGVVEWLPLTSHTNVIYYWWDCADNKVRYSQETQEGVYSLELERADTIELADHIVNKHHTDEVLKVIYELIEGEDLIKDLPQ